MMRIGFSMSWGYVGDKAIFEEQRFAIWMRVAELLGHQVVLCDNSRRPKLWADLPQHAVWDEPADVYFCVASGYPKGFPGWLTPRIVCQPAARMVLEDYAVNGDVVVGSPNDTLPAWQAFLQRHRAQLGQRYLGVHFQPFFGTLDVLLADGLIDAYCRDDLAAIRARYQPPEKHQKIGFRGCTWNIINEGYPLRSEVFQHYYDQPWCNFKSTGDPANNLDSRGTLQDLASNALTMALLGDRVKTHRHVEAPMMGSPIVCVPGELEVEPAHDASNSVCLKHWFDRESAQAGLERATDLVTGSDVAYRAGWSLAGQFQSALRKLGV
jgi:hypothetical protein